MLGRHAAHAALAAAARARGPCALRGAGDTRFPLYAILTGLFLCRLAAAYFLVAPYVGGVVAVWCCLLADYAVRAALLFWRFASGRWEAVHV